jgi:hypothetical protein
MDYCYEEFSGLAKKSSHPRTLSRMIIDHSPFLLSLSHHSFTAIIAVNRYFFKGEITQETYGRFLVSLYQVYK